MLNLLTVTNIFDRLPVILFIPKRIYHTARHQDFTESVQIMSFLIKRAMTQRNIYQKGAAVRKWYIRKYFGLELFPRMHFQGKSIIRRSKITFSIIYHPVFRDVRKILEELYVILASDDRHKKDVPMIVFKINKNLKAHLVRSQLPNLDEVGRSKLC